MRKYLLNKLGLQSTRSRVQQARLQSYTSIISAWVPSGVTLLDLGCGDGLFASFFAETKKVQPTLADVADNRKSARSRQFPFVKFDGVSLPLGDASQDVVLAIDVLHHTADSEAVMHEACRVARQIVIVIEQTPTKTLARWWLQLVDRFFSWSWIGEPLRFRSEEQWHKLFEKVGFKVSESCQFRYRPLWPITFPATAFLLRHESEGDTKSSEQTNL